MPGQPTKTFDLVGGFQDLRAANQVVVTYLTIVLGIVGHWVWEVLVAGIGTGKIEWGTLGIILARIGVAVIAGIFSFTGIWRQLENVDPKIRFFAAFTQGFAVDALTGPVVDKAGAASTGTESPQAALLFLFSWFG